MGRVEVKVTDGRVIQVWTDAGFGSVDMNYVDCVKLLPELVRAALEVGPRGAQYPGWPRDVHLEAILGTIKAHCADEQNRVT